MEAGAWGLGDIYTSFPPHYSNQQQVPEALTGYSLGPPAWRMGSLQHWFPEKVKETQGALEQDMEMQTEPLPVVCGW